MPLLVYIHAAEGQINLKIHPSSIILPSFLHSFMDARCKFGISRLVRASFASCKSKRLSNDTQDPVFSHHHFRQLQPPSSPLTRSTSSPSLSPDFEPKSQLKLQEILEHSKEENPTKMMIRRRRRKKKKQKRNIPSSSSSGADSRELFSSDGEREEETETLVSSKSFSSESPELCCRRCRRATAKSHRRRMHARNSDAGFPEALASVSPNATVLGGKVRDSVAVVKRTNDPRGDFRRSMMEMIVEKQMFAAKDLQQLLHCFLSLNSVHHHQVIVEAFMDIWDALFDDWP